MEDTYVQLADGKRGGRNINVNVNCNSNCKVNNIELLVANAH